MPARSLGIERWAYRPGQTALLLSLATLVVLACATGPLYERAVEEATTNSVLRGAPGVDRGLVIGLDEHTRVAAVAPRGAAAALFRSPVAGTDVPVALNRAGPRVRTTLSYRDNACVHLRFEAGRCPAADGEVAASATAARALHLILGARVPVSLVEGSYPHPLSLTLQVVGLYHPFAASTDYWFGNDYSSSTGIRTSDVGQQADAFFGTRPYVARAADRMTSDQGNSPAVFVDVALRVKGVDVAELGVLRGVVSGLTAAVSAHRPGTATSLTTALPQYLDEIDAGRRDTRQVVLAIASQLALLSVIGFGVAAAAAARQRRPELALARLRGASRARAAMSLIGDIGSLVLLAIVPGLLLAYAVVYSASRHFLTSNIAPQLRLPVFAAAGGAVAAVLIIVAAVAYQASRQPITDLLREVPARRSRIAAGAAEVAVAVASAAGLLVSLSGGRRTALATLTPTFLAALVGLVLSRVLVAAARRAGRRALWRGSLSWGLAGLSIARRSGARLTITVVSVATAVVVFAAQQWGVGARNRSERAAAVTGAAVILDVQAPAAGSLLRAVAKGDPSARWASPVVAIRPPGVGAIPVVAVDPESFGAVASWGRASLRPSTATLRRLHPPSPAVPIEFHGERITLTLASGSYRYQAKLRQQGAPPPSVRLRLHLEHTDGARSSATFSRVPAVSNGPMNYSAVVGCEAGCRVTGLSIVRADTDSTPVRLDVVVSALHATAGGVQTALHIGTAADWVSVSPPSSVPETSDKTAMAAEAAAGGLRFTAVDDGSGDAMQYLDRPVGAPALVAGAVPPDRDDLGYVTADLISCRVGRVVVRGTVPFVPQFGGAALLIDLGLQSRLSAHVDPTATAQVWLRTANSARERVLRQALHRAGIAVLDRQTTAELSQKYAQSAPAWSAQLSLIAAILSELLAVTLLTVVLLTSRRARELDLSSMRLSGVLPRRLSASVLLELVAVVVVGVVAGVIAGLVGVHMSLPAIPIFSAPSDLPLPVIYATTWGWLGGAVLLSLLPLLGAAAAVTSRLVRSVRADPANAVLQ